MGTEDVGSAGGRANYAAREWLRGYCQADSRLADMMIEFALAPRDQMIVRFVSWQLSRSLIILPCGGSESGNPRSGVEFLLMQLEESSTDFAHALRPFKSHNVTEHLISLLTLLSEQGIMKIP